MDVKKFHEIYMAIISQVRCCRPGQQQPAEGNLIYFATVIPDEERVSFFYICSCVDVKWSEE